MQLLTVVTFTVALLACSASGHRILGIFGHHGGSHFHTFYPIMSKLAESGHDVTVLSYFKVKNPPPSYNQIQLNGLDVINSSLPLAEVIASTSYYDLILEYRSLFELGDIVCRDIFQSKQLDKVLELHAENPFDLVVTEFFDTDCMLGIIHVMNVPFVGISSCVLMPWHYDRVAVPDLPSYVASEFVGFSEQMTFPERFKSFVVTKAMKILYKLIERNDDAYIRAKFGDNIPSVSELAKKVSLLFVNSHFAYHGSRPLPPQVIEIGGVHIKPLRPIPQDLLNILDNADEHGVILISWGSNVKTSSLPREQVDAILRAVERLPHQIILKWEDANLPITPSNVHIRPWLPQRDLLCHPNVKLFWSHGGNLGTSEAVHCGTPLVVTPIYGDQFVNTAALVRRGVAVELKIHDISEENVFQAMNEALKPEYLVNAKVTAFAFQNRPMSPVDTAVWWINHVIDTKGFPLGRSNSIEMSWFTYHSFDVILALFAILILVLAPLYFLVKWMYCSRHRNPTNGLHKSKKRKQN